jgi:hypothetical protein
MNHHLSEITSQAAADGRAVVILDRGLTTSHYRHCVPIAGIITDPVETPPSKDPPAATLICVDT